MEKYVKASFTLAGIEFEKGRYDCLKRSSMMKCTSDKTTAGYTAVPSSNLITLHSVAHSWKPQLVHFLSYYFSSQIVSLTSYADLFHQYRLSWVTV